MYIKYFMFVKFQVASNLETDFLILSFFSHKRKYFLRLIYSFHCEFIISDSYFVGSVFS